MSARLAAIVALTAALVPATTLISPRLTARNRR